uniref:hypothetical protein n=1 Tax=Candidatus Electronema sp. TaxID=2698783 RepID=UPI004055D366
MTSQNEDAVIAVIIAIIALFVFVVALVVIYRFIEITIKISIYLILILLLIGGYIVRAISWFGRIISIPLGIFLGISTYSQFYFIEEISRQEEVKIVLSIGIWTVSIYFVSSIAYKIAKKVTKAVKEELGWIEKGSVSISTVDEKKVESAWKIIEKMKKMTSGQMESYTKEIQNQLLDGKLSIDIDSLRQVKRYLNNQIAAGDKESEIYKKILFYIEQLTYFISIDEVESTINNNI